MVNRSPTRPRTTGIPHMPRWPERVKECEHVNSDGSKCDRPYWRPDWCRTHHAQHAKHGRTFDIGELKRTSSRKHIGCAFAGCDRVHRTRGYCRLHYNQWMRTGCMWPLGAYRAYNDKRIKTATQTLRAPGYSDEQIDKHPVLRKANAAYMRTRISPARILHRLNNPKPVKRTRRRAARRTTRWKVDAL